MTHFTPKTHSNTDFKAAYKHWIKEANPAYFLTLMSNQARSADYIKARTKLFLRHANASLFGRRWHSKSSSQLINGFCVIEKINVNVHVHALVDIPKFQLETLEDKVELAWKKACASGTADLLPITDLDGATDYIMKESGRFNFFNQQVFLTSEFHTR